MLQTLPKEPLTVVPGRTDCARADIETFLESYLYTQPWEVRAEERFERCRGQFRSYGLSTILEPVPILENQTDLYQLIQSILLVSLSHRVHADPKDSGDPGDLSRVSGKDSVWLCEAEALVFLLCLFQLGRKEERIPASPDQIEALAHVAELSEGGPLIACMERLEKCLMVVARPGVSQVYFDGSGHVSDTPVELPRQGAELLRAQAPGRSVSVEDGVSVVNAENGESVVDLRKIHPGSSAWRDCRAIVAGLGSSVAPSLPARTPVDRGPFTGFQELRLLLARGRKRKNCRGPPAESSTRSDLPGLEPNTPVTYATGPKRPSKRLRKKSLGGSDPPWETPPASPPAVPPNYASTPESV